MNYHLCDQLRTPEYDKWCIEQARAYMEHIHGLRLRIDALQYQIDDARNNMLPGGVRYDKGTNGTTSPDDKLVDGLAMALPLVFPRPVAVAACKQSYCLCVRCIFCVLVARC